MKQKEVTARAAQDSFVTRYVICVVSSYNHKAFVLRAPQMASTGPAWSNDYAEGGQTSLFFSLFFLLWRLTGNRENREIKGKTEKDMLR